jgi:hypothetical protein
MGAITVVISIFDVAISYATAYARPTGAIGPRVLYLRLARVCPIIVGQCNGLSRGTEPDIITVSLEQRQADMVSAAFSFLVRTYGGRV